MSILILTIVIAPSVIENELHFGETASLVVAQKTQQRNSNKTENPASSQGEEKGENTDENKSKEERKLNIFKIVTGALAGLVLFLYGVTRMAEGLEAIAGDRARELISKFTTNRYAGVATGTVATTILDSSSVTIIIVIAMVSAGLLTFVESLGVVLGANIGTTIGAQIIAFKINEYAPIAMFVGFLLTFLGKTDRWKKIGLVVLGLGLLFFGLDTIEDAMEPFKDYQPFITWMERLGENTLLGALVGALFTVLIQSSSATVAVVVTLASQGLVSLPAGIALVLGAEVGTCADTLVATIGRDRPAVRTGVFHLLFNIVCAIVGIFFASQLAAIAQWVTQLVGTGDNVARQIANAQLIFNLAGVALVIGFLPLIARALERLIPDRKNQNREAEAVKN
ncbi:Na/Pi symporter [Dendronalium sp. ChiSLP03b]|uniref:Na/Pi cotransporter family protein n=1 Tax=Dendronalium sp. ChiSLP03b TaxID=3075381 RepID=UPI002AD51907|nr:Na/Pi symporter [Dendronalium sp. ChiSLP03b]MDZ8209232.1 Na/Pi symporter [Dendronalium sp. ChiSLP03b]